MAVCGRVEHRRVAEAAGCGRACCGEQPQAVRNVKPEGDARLQCSWYLYA